MVFNMSLNNGYIGVDKRIERTGVLSLDKHYLESLDRTIETISTSGLVVWLDADDLALGTLTTWPDKSGQGNDFEQTNASYKPVVASGICNGHNGVTFTSDWLTCINDVEILPHFSLFMVMKINNAIDSRATRISFTENGGSYGYWVEHYYTKADSNQGKGLLRPSGSNYLKIALVTSYEADYHIAEMHVHDGTHVQSASIFMNGNWINGEYMPAAPEAHMTPGKPRIGYRNSGETGGYLDGDICEVIIYNRYIYNTPEFLDVRNYLANKYAITLEG